jgi:hypothetical protein
MLDFLLIVTTRADIGDTMTLEQRLDSIFDDVATLSAGCIQELAKRATVVALVKDHPQRDPNSGIVTHALPPERSVWLVRLAPYHSHWRWEQDARHIFMHYQGTRTRKLRARSSTHLDGLYAPVA